MPRSKTRPQVGDIIWYFAAAPPVAGPLPATVLRQVATSGSGVGSTPPTFDLAVSAVADGTVTFAAAVPFHYGTRPTTGAWCTMPRVNTPAAGVWPSGNLEVQDYVEHGLNEEQRAAHIQQLLEKAQEAAQAAPASASAGNPGKTRSELELMTKDQLVAYADDHDIEVSSTWVKADIVNAILQGQTTPA
jgi:hypothetical protein